MRCLDLGRNHPIRALRRDECRRDGRLGKICAPTLSRKLAKRHGVKRLSLLFVSNPTGLFARRRLALFEQSLSPLQALHPILSQVAITNRPQGLD